MCVLINDFKLQLISTIKATDIKRGSITLIKLRICIYVRNPQNFIRICIYLRCNAVWSQSMARWEEGESTKRSSAEQGRAQPRQKRCHWQREHQDPSRSTSFRVNGYSYRRLSSLKGKPDV